jgi:3-hydroxybutyryl-CoA dehydrogenase
MKTRTVGVLGAGVMGSGVAQALAQTHHQVILVDIAPDILSRAEQLIRQNTRWMRMFDSKKRATDIDTVISRIPFTTDHKRLHDMPIAIENVTEKWEIKKPLDQKMNAICGAACPWPKHIREGINHE